MEGPLGLRCQSGETRECMLEEKTRNLTFFLQHSIKPELGDHINHTSKAR